MITLYKIAKNRMEYANTFYKIDKFDVHSDDNRVCCLYVLRYTR